MIVASHFGFNPLHLSPMLWSVLLGIAIGLILALVALYYSERVDKRNSGDLLDPEDAASGDGRAS